jgi:uncharacterized Ntn-hydrolase superfamily protein
VRRATLCAAVLALASGCATSPQSAAPLPASPSTLDMTTWSIIAIDPATGDVGVAMASCVPETHGDGVGVLVPGHGVAAVQASWDLANRDLVYDALREGLPAQEVIDRVIDPAADSTIGRRQYAVLTLDGASVRAAGFTGEPILARFSDPESPSWAGIMADVTMGVSAQGNTLVGPAVVGESLAAFQRYDLAGRNTLADRLMRGLEGGAIAGGDVRCNNEHVVQTAATAVILVARGGDAPYTTPDIGQTDQGTDAAPWLALSVSTERFGANPIVELRERYDAWRRSLPN